MEDRAPVFSISVRRLAERVYRTGGLSPVGLTGIDPQDGQKAHRRALEILAADPRFTDCSFSPERFIKGLIHSSEDDVDLSLRGRSDLLIQDQKKNVILYEFKTVRSSANFPQEPLLAHWAQLKLYAALLFHEPDFEKKNLDLRILYVGLEDFSTKEFEAVLECPELESFLQESAHLYLQTIIHLVHQEKRNQSLLSSHFPYATLRDGQDEMMRTVVSSLRRKEALFVEAPTGIGKTIGVLYPSLKALAKGYVKRVFYATAMTSTRLVVENALCDLRQSGAYFRSLTLTPKQSICCCPDLYCDTQTCPFAVHYYDHLGDALEAALKYEHLTGNILREIAQEFQVCPFELSLDVAFYCDVIVGDYNHVFDPRIRLKRFFEDEAESPLAILIDEAHNLPSRSRLMHSAEFNSSGIRQWLKLWEGSNAPFNGQYEALYAWLKSMEQRLAAIEQVMRCQMELSQTGEGYPEDGDSLRDFISSDNNPLVQTSDPEDWHLSGTFLGLKKKPTAFLSALNKGIFLLREFLQEETAFEERKDCLLLYFEWLFFYRIGTRYFDKAFLTAARLTPSQLRLFLLCLDASEPLTKTYYDRHPVVFFSATLSPMPYYQSLLDKKYEEDPPRAIQLYSPFPKENRLVLVDQAASLKWENRQSSLGTVLSHIYAACEQKIGNYLVFCPSYAYLKELRQLIKQADKPNNTDLMVQVPGMSERQKRYFLNRFEKYGERSLIGFAVLGSLFNEGIDLVGEKLSGVIVISVGLPGLSPERELMSRFYQEQRGDGFLYAYVYPGFNRVEQAAGRLIRTENDRGFVLLLDQRWGKMPYTSLIPGDWDVENVETADDLRERLAQFWSELDS